MPCPDKYGNPYATSRYQYFMGHKLASSKLGVPREFLKIISYLPMIEIFHGQQAWKDECHFYDKILFFILDYRDFPLNE